MEDPEGIEDFPVPHPRFPSGIPLDNPGVPVHGLEIGRLGDAEGIPEQNYQQSDGRVLGHLVLSVLPSVGITHIAVGFQSQKSTKTQFALAGKGSSASPGGAVRA